MSCLVWVFCQVGLAPSHPIIAQQLEIESITFKNSNGRDLLDLSGMKGKKKNGAMKLEPESALCRVHCKNGKQFVIRSVVRGILIEGNHRLVSNPAF